MSSSILKSETKTKSMHDHLTYLQKIVSDVSTSKYPFHVIDRVKYITLFKQVEKSILDFLYACSMNSKKRLC